MRLVRAVRAGFDQLLRAVQAYTRAFAVPLVAVVGGVRFFRRVNDLFTNGTGIGG